MCKADRARGTFRGDDMSTDAVLPVGIDVAKRTLQVSLRRADGKRRHKSVSNDRTGHQQLLAWLGQQGVYQVHACLEATGTFAEAVATVLVDAGHTASIVNPAAVKAFAASQLRRTKKDRVDAGVLLDFCVAHQPAAWTPWPGEVRALQCLVRRADALQDMLTQERNRLAAGGATSPVEASLERHIAMLETELADLQRQIRDHLDQHPGLRAQRDLLETIPGLGTTTIARLLAECRSISAFDNARAYAAFSGLVPRERPSGTLRGRPRLAKL